MNHASSGYDLHETYDNESHTTAYDQGYHETVVPESAHPYHTDFCRPRPQCCIWSSGCNRAHGFGLREDGLDQLHRSLEATAGTRCRSEALWNEKGQAGTRLTSSASITLCLVPFRMRSRKSTETTWKVAVRSLRT